MQQIASLLLQVNLKEKEKRQLSGISTLKKPSGRPAYNRIYFNMLLSMHSAIRMFNALKPLIPLSSRIFVPVCEPPVFNLTTIQKKSVYLDGLWVFGI